MFRSFFDLLGFANDAFDFFFFMISFCGVWAHHTLQSMFMLPSPPHERAVVRMCVAFATYC